MNDPGSNDDGADPVLKRKASDDSIEGGPSQKTQHTGITSFSKGSILQAYHVHRISSQQQKIHYNF